MRSTFILLCALIITVPTAVGQVTKEFNWIPSGTIDVGELTSEYESKYSAVGEDVRTDLKYSDGERVVDTGRVVGSELFEVKVARFRAGPAGETLVIRKRIDTAMPTTTLKVTIEEKELPEWTIAREEGNRRWRDVFYAVPKEALQEERGGRPFTKWVVRVSIEAPEPTPSYRYDFFITRDWGVLGEGLLGQVIERQGDDVGIAYLNGLALEGDHQWEAAIEEYRSVAERSDYFELGRIARRRIRHCRYAMEALRVVDTREEKHFDDHYALGLYCDANGFWGDALTEYEKTVVAEPSHADATYHLAEAMEYNRIPVEKYAALFERAGTLYNRTDTNETTCLVAINTYELPGGQKRKLSKGSIEALYRDWRICEQMVYGASRGMFKINSTYRIWHEGGTQWTMQAGWLWGPPDSEVPVRGTYDFSECFAEYGSSHAGGGDCGVSGAAASQIGPTRGWEVILHEWNHQFDWTAIVGEQGKGYPTTHDSDGCGKQPIVNMGCGHRSSMRYYLTPAQYRRIETSDPELVGNHIKTWICGGYTAGAKPPVKASGEKFESWLIKGKWFTEEEIKRLREQWEQETKQKKNGVDYNSWLYERYVGKKAVDAIAARNEKKIIANAHALKGRRVESEEEFIDLLRISPRAADKAVAYAQTFVWSPKIQEVRIWIGYNDCAKVWLNGRLIHTGHYYATAKWKDANRTDMVANHGVLESGWNRILVKTERGGGDWGFSIGICTFDNQPVPGLRYQSDVPRGKIAVYEPPKVGVHYKWDDVKDDYTELLPQLTVDDLREITGIEGLQLVENAFFIVPPADAVPEGARAITSSDLMKKLSGVDITLNDFFTAGKPEEVKKELLQDVTLNNFLNFDREAVAAMRYLENGKQRDLLLIRPEYYEEYLVLLDEKPSDLEGKVTDRILGYLFVPHAAYSTTGNRTWRIVLVAKTFLGDYPIDEEDLLQVPTVTTAAE